MNKQTSSNNRSFLQRPGAVLYDDPDEALEQITGGTVTSSTTTSAVVGTPEDLVVAIRQVAEVAGGFGKVIGFAHDWANREDTLRSWDLV
ncbi:MAG: limonene 1,2-monooxygenase, partial [Acidimicrobiales bacterium]